MESEPVPVREAARRLHPSSLAFRFAGHLKPFVVPLFLAVVVTGGDNTEAWFAVALGPLMLFELIRYFTFRYRFTAEGIVVRHGLIFRNERLVPFVRIQNLETRTGLFHRLLGVVDVRLETATGSEPEAKLTVVRLERLSELERRLEEGRGRSGATEAEPSEAEPSHELYALPLEEAVLLGLSPWKGLALVGVAVGLFFESGPWDRLDFEKDWRELKGDWLGMVDPSSWWLGALVGFVLIGALFALSILVTLVRLYDFRVERKGKSLRITSGLLTRHVTNLDTARIQTVTVRRPWLLRCLGRASIRVSTAATVEDMGDESASRQWFAPVVREDRLDRLLGELDPRLVNEEIPWQPLAPSAARRMTVAACVRSALISVPLALNFGWMSLPLIVPLWALSILHARLAARRSAFARTPDLVLDRDGVLTQRETLAFVDRIQAVGLHESPFDRRHATVQVRVDTAGGSKLVPAVRIPYLEVDRAEALRRGLLSEIQRIA